MIQENVFQSVICEMAAILSLPQCFKFSWNIAEMVNSLSIVHRHRENFWTFTGLEDR